MHKITLSKLDFSRIHKSIHDARRTNAIGYKVSDEIEWIVPSGLTKLLIDEIIYQPEAAGDLDL